MQTVSGNEISNFGIGTYGIGGRGHRDMALTEKQADDKYVKALVYSLEKRSNFTEISLGYGHGLALKLFKQALDESSATREQIFLTHSLYTRDLPSGDTIHDDVKNFYKTMGADYADSTLVTQSVILRFGKEVIYPILNDLLRSYRTRFVSLSNASPTWIQDFKREFGDKFFAHEGHLSFEVRALQDKGIFKLCDELQVQNIIWRPLRRNLTMIQKWPLLIELSKKHGKTQSQIILNWMCNLGFRPMVFSTNPLHIDENLASTDFKMAEEDYKLLTDFRPTNYSPPTVDWEGPKIDNDIVALANEFETHFSK